MSSVCVCFVYEKKTLISNKLFSRGICIKCKKDVYWATTNLASHKRTNCTISEDDKKFWVNLKKKEVEVVVVASDNVNVSPAEPKKASSSLRQYTDTITESVINAANKALAKVFFRCALPFRVVESSAFKQFVNVIRPSFGQHMVSANTLSGRYLDEEYKEGHAKLKKLVNDSEGYVIVSDGWSNVNRQHLVSFIIYVKGSKPFFYKICDTSHIYMNAQNNADLIMEVAKELGTDKWLAVVTDNAPVLQAAWKIIEAEFPKVFANGCIAHGFNSFLQDIYKSSTTLQERLKDSYFLIKTVHNHTRLNETFQKIKKDHGIGARLQNPVPTRFSSEFISAESVLKNKSVFFYLVQEHEVLLKESLKPAMLTKFTEIINNSCFWMELRFIVKDLFAKPAEIIKMVEGDNVNIGMVYDVCLDMQEALRNISHDTLIDKEKLEDLFDRRWTKMDFDCFGYAHILNPMKLVANRMNTDDYLRTVSNLKKYLRNFYSDDLGKSNLALTDLNAYFVKFEGKSCDFVSSSYDENPVSFWAIYGSKLFPQLAPIASRLYRIVPSSAASERGWNVFGTIHTKKRNRLSTEKVEKIAFVYINAALLDEIDSFDYRYDIADDFTDDTTPDIIEIE